MHCDVEWFSAKPIVPDWYWILLPIDEFPGANPKPQFLTAEILATDTFEKVFKGCRFCRVAPYPPIKAQEFPS